MAIRCPHLIVERDAVARHSPTVRADSATHVMRPSLQNTAIALLALGLLVFFLRNANLGVVWMEIKDADIWLLLVALTTTM